MKKSMGNGYVSGSPYAGNGYNARLINPSGNINNNNARNGNGVAPDCEMSQIAVSPHGPNPAHSRKERLSSSSGEDDEQIDADAVGSDRAGTAIHSALTPKEQICSFEALYKAAFVCRRNVMWKDSVAGFIRNALINCHALHDELMNDTYKLSGYSIFTVYEKKARVIVSTRMRDRVVQRSLCDNYLTEHLTKGFIYDNCACLPGKGADMARHRLKCHLQRFYRKHGVNGWVLKVDIHDYFGSTLHDVANAAVAKRVPDPWVKKQVFDIIDSFDHIAPDRGMGLGSQITQLVQLAVLDDMDHYIKETLRIRGYVRYMDDFILIHEDKEYLKRCLDDIVGILADIGLKINTKKTGIQPARHGIHFLGFSFRLTCTGKVIQTVLHKKVSKERRKLRKLVERVKDGRMTKRQVDECYKAWRAHVEKGNCRNLLSRMDAFYKNLYTEGGKECSSTNQ